MPRPLQKPASLWPPPKCLLRRLSKASTMSQSRSRREEKQPSQILQRPRTAHGTFLRILTINDVYNLETYPRFAWGVQAAKDVQGDLDCVVKSFLSGDFLSPAVHTSLDNGKALMGGLNMAKVDYLSLGNHEFDIGFGCLEARIKEFTSGTFLNSNIKEPAFLERDYPDHIIFDIGERKAVIGAYLTDKIDIYPPNWTPTISPIDSCIPTTWEKAKKSLGGRVPDLFIPMTHQLVHQDAATYKQISKHAELSCRTPVMLGGHDHEVYLQESACGMIIKVGYNAQKVGVVDVWWDVDGQMHSSVNLVPIGEFPEYQAGKEYAQRKARQLDELMSVPITTIPFSASTKLIRFEETPMAKFLMSSVKKGLRQFKVEVAMLQAGAIRGLSDYQTGPFTMGGLFAEFAYELKIGIVDVPGWVVAQTVKSTRSLPKPAPPFVHLDEECTVNELHDVLTLDGKPIELDKVYRCCTWLNALKGVDNLQPLVDYVRDNNLMPDDEICIPGKETVLKLWMREAWRKVVHFDEWDADHDGHVSQEELKTGLDKTLALLDKNGDGVVDTEELVALLEKNMHVEHSRALAVKMFKVLGEDHDGVLSRKALSKLVT